MKTMVINGRKFQVINSKNWKSSKQFECGGRTLGSVYKTPSSAKVRVWNSWYLWACENNQNGGLHTHHNWVHQFGVCNGNSWNFTIRGLYTDENGQDYGIMITSTENRLYVF